MEAPAADATQDKPAAETAAPDATALEISLTPAQLAALGVPADAITPENLLAAIDAALEKAAAGAALQTQLDEATGKLGEFEQAARERDQAALDELLAEYDLDEAAAADIRGMEAPVRERMLGRLPKKPVPALADETTPPASDSTLQQVPVSDPRGTPPDPTHTPGDDQELTPEKKAADSEALIAAIKKEGRVKGYEAAREEARRRKPELFS